MSEVLHHENQVQQAVPVDHQDHMDHTKLLNGLELEYNPDAVINVVIPLKNRGKHIRLLMQNIQDIVDQTNEKHIKVWIGDFHSHDVNLKKLQEHHTFPIHIVLFEGVFKIAGALQGTAEKIKNPNEILYFCDADSVFPTCIFERIRKLTIKNKAFYVPMVGRSTREGKVVLPTKDHGGKGNVGVYVDDFQKSGGWGIGYFYQDGLGSGNPLARRQWGKHDEHIFHLLKIHCKLQSMRTRESDQYTRWHQPRMGWGK